MTFACINCEGVYEIDVIDEGQKVTEPSMEFCPFCSMPYDEAMEPEEEGK